MIVSPGILGSLPVLGLHQNPQPSNLHPLYIQDSALDRERCSHRRPGAEGQHGVSPQNTTEGVQDMSLPNSLLWNIDLKNALLFIWLHWVLVAACGILVP